MFRWISQNARSPPSLADLAQEYPKENGNRGVSTVPLRDAMAGDTRTPLVVLMASAAFVLLIARANLAGALLSRSISRRKEFEVRVALGAGRRRLIRQLLTKSTMLALVGGAVGLLLAAGILVVLRALVLLVLPIHAHLSIHLAVVLVTVLLALCTGLSFGLARWRFPSAAWTRRPHCATKLAAQARARDRIICAAPSQGRLRSAPASSPALD